MGDISTRPGSALGLLQGLYQTRSLFGTLLDFSVSSFVFKAWNAYFCVAYIFEVANKNVSNVTINGQWDHKYHGLCRLDDK